MINPIDSNEAELRAVRAYGCFWPRLCENAVSS